MKRFIIALCTLFMVGLVTCIYGACAANNVTSLERTLEPATYKYHAARAAQARAMDIAARWDKETAAYLDAKKCPPRNDVQSCRYAAMTTQDLANFWRSNAEEEQAVIATIPPRHEATLAALTSYQGHIKAYKILAVAGVIIMVPCLLLLLVLYSEYKRFNL